jgi:hypothetical protein
LKIVLGEEELETLESVVEVCLHNAIIVQSKVSNGVISSLQLDVKFNECLLNATYDLRKRILNGAIIQQDVKIHKLIKSRKYPTILDSTVYNTAEVTICIRPQIYQKVEVQYSEVVLNDDLVLTDLYLKLDDQMEILGNLHVKNVNLFPKIEISNTGPSLDGWLISGGITNLSFQNWLSISPKSVRAQLNTGFQTAKQISLEFTIDLETQKITIFKGTIQIESRKLEFEITEKEMKFWCDSDQKIIEILPKMDLEIGPTSTYGILRLVSPADNSSVSLRLS